MDLGIEVPKKSQEKEVPSDIKNILKEAENRDYQNFMCCLVIGQDDTAKTGIVLDYCSKLPKKTIVLDVDLGAYEVKTMYHKDSKKIIIPGNILVMDKTTGDISYEETLKIMRQIVNEIKENSQEYSAIVVDGISTLLKYAEYLMRIEKNIAPDGGVNLRYWIQRNKRFIEFLESVKSIPNIDKFFIGHEDFIIGEEAASVKVKTNQAVHQRVICTKETDKKTGTVTFKARVDKSKYNLKKQGKEYIIAIVPQEDEPTWNGSGKLFEGLK